MKVEHELLLRATQPERFAQLEEAGDLDALTVMRENMVFFHVRAAEILASLMAWPLGEDANADQLAGMKDFAGIVRCRELAQQCARDLARYTHPPMAPIAPGALQGPGNARQLNASPRPRRSVTRSSASRTDCRQSHVNACDVGVEVWVAALHPAKPTRFRASVADGSSA